MRLSLRFLLLVAALVIGVLAGGNFPQPPGATARAAGASEPSDPPPIDLAGYNQLLAGYRGKAIMVNFWATWCEPCRNEYPMIISLSKEYASQGLVVIGVSLDEDSGISLVRHFFAQSRPDSPNFRERGGIDANTFLRGVNPDWHGTMPQTDFYARDGHLARYFVGDRPRDVYVQAIRLILAVPMGENLRKDSGAEGE